MDEPQVGVWGLLDLGKDKHNFSRKDEYFGHTTEKDVTEEERRKK